MGKRRKAAAELFKVVEEILKENDCVDPTKPRSAILPGQWRSPLVRAANKYLAARDG